MVKLKVYTVDSLGRIVLPKVFRQLQGWEYGAKVAVYQDHNILILKLAEDYEEADDED